MTELENRLRTEDTEVLQGKLASASYTDDAAAIARAVLAERGAQTPTPRTEEETELLERESMRRSTVKFGAVVLWLLCVWAFALYRPERYYALLGSFIPLAALLGLYRGR
jgi:hypothetical protein